MSPKDSPNIPGQLEGEGEQNVKFPKRLRHNGKGRVWATIYKRSDCFRLYWRQRVDGVSQYKGSVTVTPFEKHYPPDTTACIFWLKNRKQERRDRAERHVEQEIAGVPQEVVEPLRKQSVKTVGVPESKKRPGNEGSNKHC